MPRKKPPPRRIGEAPKKRRRRSNIGRLSGSRYRDEADFQDEVIRRALANQFKVFHQGDSRRILIGRGYYDLTMISRVAPRIIFAELKMPAGEVAQEQAEWGALAKSLSQFMPQVEYYLWVPQDLQAIDQILKTVPDPSRMQVFHEAMKNFQGIQ